MTNPRTEQYFSFGISLGVHLFLLLILALYVIPPMASPKWYEFSFPDRAVVEPLLASNSENLSPTSGVPTSIDPVNPKDAQRIDRQVQAPASAPPAEARNTPQTTTSELIEVPFETSDPAQTKLSQGKNPLAIKALTAQLSGVPTAGSQGSVEHQVEGGRLRFTLNSSYSLEYTDFGIVVLTFKVDKHARLIPSSINAVPPVDMKFLGEARRILQEGSLRFEGKPDPTALYQIKFTFNLKQKGRP